MSGPFQGGASAARVQVVIVTHESRETIALALDSLRGAALPLDACVVDNASADDTASFVRRHYPTVRVLACRENRGFAAGCNAGWRSGNAPYVLLLNPDAECLPGALERLTARLDERPDAAVVGPRTLNPDGSVQVSTGPDLSLLSEWRQRRLVAGVRRRDAAAIASADARHARAHEPDWVSGSCLMVRRAALEAAGGLDEGFFLYEEDADLCRRVRQAGWRVLFEPGAVVRHRLGHSMGRAAARARLEYHRSHLRYYARHAGAGPRLALRALVAARGALAWVRGVAQADAVARSEGLQLARLALARRLHDDRR